MRSFILFLLACPCVMASAAPKMLFLCTGNYYRSRMAEAVFNFEAERAGLEWRAASRGLRTDLLDAGERAHRLSPLTAKMLDDLGIARTFTAPDPVQVTRADLKSADCVIAMSEIEHRPYLQKSFKPLGQWPLIFWRVEDEHITKPEDALPAVVERTRELVRDLKAGRVPPACRRR